MTRVAVVGAGFVGSKHARAVSEHPALDLAAVVDVDADRAVEVADDHGARATTEYEAAFDDADAAIVATPRSAHVEQAHAALDRGLHLLLEKPVTETVEEAAALAERAAATDRATGVSYLLRYDRAYASAHEAVASGDVGEVVALRAKRAVPAAEARRVADHGHLLYTMLVHDIDAMVWHADAAVERVSAVERRGELADVGLPDAVQALFEFENGATGVLEGHGVLPPDAPGGIESGFELVGTRGTASVEMPDDAVTVRADAVDRPDARLWPVVNGRIDGALRRQIDRFARATAGDCGMRATFGDAVRAQAVAHAAEDAIDRASPVAVDCPSL